MNILAVLSKLVGFFLVALTLVLLDTDGNSVLAFSQRDYCLGDGNGPIIVSSRDFRAVAAVCGRDRDLIRYWYNGTCLFHDGIRDGDGLTANDVMFPSAPTTSLLPIPPLAVRHGRLRDLIRIYAPQKGSLPGLVTIYQRRKEERVRFGWIGIDRLDVAGTTFSYDSSKNAFVGPDSFTEGRPC
jgi:hypothetical protein